MSHRPRGLVRARVNRYRAYLKKALGSERVPRRFHSTGWMDECGRNLFNRVAARPT